MCLLKGLGLTLLLLVVARAEEVEEYLGTLSSRGGRFKLQKRVSDLEKEVRELVNKNEALTTKVDSLTGLEKKVYEVVDINAALNDKVESLTGEIRNNKKQVAFSGRIGTDLEVAWGLGKIIKFGEITTNIGNPYNTGTGIFRCPVDGLYLFSCSILGSTPGNLSVRILQNGKIIARPWAGTSSNRGYNAASDTAVVHANEGDDIYMKIEGGNSRILDKFTRCSGVLLKTDK